MRLKSTAAYLVAFLFCIAATGCHVGGGYGGCGSGCDASPMGCDGGGCASGSCGGLSGLLGGYLKGGCGAGAGNCVTPAELAGDGYGVRGGHAGPLAGHFGQHHRGPQSHMGPLGPASGPAVPQTTYPYYTTRGPRDFFAANPPSIGP